MSVPPTSKLTSSIPLDLYPPEPLLAEDDSSLVVLILQGVEIDKSEYSAIAKELNRHQFWVIVPNCYPVGRDYICPENYSAKQVINALQYSPSQPLYQALQRGVILLGHSAGGMAALAALNDNLSDLFSPLVAIATYGSNTPFNISHISSLPPVLMLSGEKDSVVSPVISRAAFQRIPTAKTFIELKGLNHYSINNTPQPIGAPLEENKADLSNRDSVHFVASLLTSFVQRVKSQDENWFGKQLQISF
ncbi:hypothetical protein IQ264_08895 [Phormidium sp. LEGE 05292]|uniref:alpha/beta hydrolase n=1 Tax=[Phormidium] sp. LEGE 05292 TaxID=767427 RepID=UPI0018829BC5|nr:alpha/beta hydrolase [Phormidium sp. LEGE 05292]MBE9225537.1 hypothetical protein [Phormidium sp. LEGE 05292]